MSVLRKPWIWIVGVAVVVPIGVALVPNGELPKATGEESLFAEIDGNGVVLRVIVADAEVINSGLFGDPQNWVRTYMDGRKRGKYAGKGDVYGKDVDIFATSTEALDNLR